MKRKARGGWFATILFTVISLFYVAPLFIVLINSFKKKAFINLEPFKLPSEKTWVALENFANAMEKYNFLESVLWTVVMTVGSVVVILPFQMVMFTLSLVTDRLRLGTPWGLVIIYLGFGAGLAVFMFCGFVKSIPIEIEEAAMIDGCSPLRTFFSVVLPIMKPTYISVGILETMWIWNDFLLPYLTLDLNKFSTIPITIQRMQGSYGRVDMGAIMASLVMAIIPIVVFYLSCQKHIIKGVAAGAVKG